MDRRDQEGESGKLKKSEFRKRKCQKCRSFAGLCFLTAVLPDDIMSLYITAAGQKERLVPAACK